MKRRGLLILLMSLVFMLAACANQAGSTPSPFCTHAGSGFGRRVGFYGIKPPKKQTSRIKEII